LFGNQIAQTQRTRYRGVEYDRRQFTSGLPTSLWGVNVALEQYNEAELTQALRLLRSAGFHWLRQHISWNETQPTPEQFQWDKWDQLIARATQEGFEIIAVLDGAPLWARAAVDRDNPFAPPAEATSYAQWAGAFAARYGNVLRAYQIWDAPNIWPNGGKQGADPARYVNLLRASWTTIKQDDPDAWIISAGLAPTVEESERNQNEVLYLQSMYDAGAAAYFDILGAKPYGFWSGPEDRQVDRNTLNFARLILLREVMRQRGDGQKTIWAVEMGWNALPEDWKGQPSPWGTDSEAKQAERLVDAVERARAEWPWLGLMCAQHFQPAAEASDPLWGFALVGRDFAPRLVYQRLQAYIAFAAQNMPIPPRPHFGALGAAFAFLALGLAVISWRGYHYASRLPWAGWWAWSVRSFAGLSDAKQAALVGATLALYVLCPWTGGALICLWLLLFFSYLRPEWTLLYATLTIPFSFYYRMLGPRGFSLAEMLIMAAMIGWVLRSLASKASLLKQPLALLGESFRWLRRLDWLGLDSVWAFFLLLAVGSLAISKNLSVSIRELRVVVLDSGLFYLLISRSPWTAQNREQKRRFVLYFADALVLAGALIAVHGLYQYVSGGDTIVAEGVRRIRGFYGSPNNMALLLGRILPLALALAIWGKERLRSIAYAPAVAFMALCLFLTFSRGAWFLGLPAALFFLGAMRQRKTLLIAIMIIVAAFLITIPIAGTERIASLFSLSGTSLFRLSLWKSTIAMIRDHPLAGLGLDNFLYYYPQYILPEALAEPNLSHPHNILLDFWTRLGIGGVAAIIGFLVVFFVRGMRLYHRLPEGDQRALVLGLLGSMVSFVAHGLVDSSYFVVELALIFALTLGLVQRLMLIEEKNL
jgi:O-antigen ligase